MTEKSSKNGISAGGGGTGGGSEIGSEGSVPQARKRARYDGKGHLLIKVGAYYRKDVYEHYRRIAFFRHLNTYDLINDAMEAYLPELEKSTTQKLREAGQETLPID